MNARHTLIRGGWILTLDARDHEHHPGDLLVEDATISAVGTNLPIPAGAEVLDATGMIVLPDWSIPSATPGRAHCATAAPTGR